MMPHLRNIKELEQPRGQLTKQTKTQQTTKKGRTDGADERRSALTPTMKAAPFPALGTGPVTVRWCVDLVRELLIEVEDDPHPMTIEELRQRLHLTL